MGGLRLSALARFFVFSFCLRARPESGMAKKRRRCTAAANAAIPSCFVLPLFDPSPLRDAQPDWQSISIARQYGWRGSCPQS